MLRGFGHKLAARYREMGIGWGVFFGFYYISLCVVLYHAVRMVDWLAPIDYMLYTLIILVAHFLTLWTLTPAAFWISIMALTMEMVAFGSLGFLLLAFEAFIRLLFTGSVISPSMFSLAALLLYLSVSGMFFFLKRKAFGVANGGQAKFRRTFCYQRNREGPGPRGRFFYRRGETLREGDSFREPYQPAARGEDEKYAEQAALYRDYEMVYLQNGAEYGWSESPNLYARCRSCGYYMWLDPGRDDSCLCGNLRKESGRLSAMLGAQTIDLYCKTPRKK